SFSSRCSAATADLLSFPTRRSSDLKRGLVQCVVAEVGQAKTQVVGHKVQAGRRHQKGGQQPAHHPGKGAAHLPHKNRRHVASSSPVPVMGSSSLSPPVSSRKRSSRLPPAVRLARSPLAASCPWDRISTRVQTACTSLRMWLDRITVWLLPSCRIRRRISITWAGSRPT